ncbi:GNAT family N-acetyltransferase, partial [Streptomyces sp. NPDC048845]|uniref:GNAT family N-acetyltransferase n=1 Tax=Streptomyces sp. NPDC048845 TaxID=3155390 RepID=UPI00342AE2A3
GATPPALVACTSCTPSSSDKTPVRPQQHALSIAMLALLDETADGTVPPQLHIVGVYTRPEYRGTGLAEELFRTAVNWAWDNTGAERVRLWVHGDNPRARAFYARLGFTPTGQTMAFPPRPDETEYELAMERPQS